ncbi:LYPD3 protein, partial [Alaudala cheleensis]|nr:LYPD3 protein [Alaudala cheleensis]
LSLSPGNFTWWRELRGCVPSPSCSRERRGDAAASLSGSCCHGDLCNRDLSDKTFFSPDLPRLELLPHGHVPTAPPQNVTS